MLNGILLTSTEPDRKTFSFDLIPAQMIDNIIINKAFVPEYPGEWAGGLIQVNTKEIPSKDFFNIQIGTGFNTQTIGKRFLQRHRVENWIGWVLMMAQEHCLKAILPKIEFGILTCCGKNGYWKTNAKCMGHAEKLLLH